MSEEDPPRRNQHEEFIASSDIHSTRTGADDSTIATYDLQLLQRDDLGRWFCPKHPNDRLDQYHNGSIVCMECQREEQTAQNSLRERKLQLRVQEERLQQLSFAESTEETLLALKSTMMMNTTQWSMDTSQPQPPEQSDEAEGASATWEPTTTATFTEATTARQQQGSTFESHPFSASDASGLSFPNPPPPPVVAWQPGAAVAPPSMMVQPPPSSSSYMVQELPQPSSHPPPNMMHSMYYDPTTIAAVVPTNNADAWLAHMQHMQERQDWMLRQRTEECASIRAQLDHATKQVEELRLVNALLQEQVAQQGERMQHELHLIRSSLVKDQRQSHKATSASSRTPLQPLALLPPPMDETNGACTNEMAPFAWDQEDRHQGPHDVPSNAATIITPHSRQEQLVPQNRISSKSSSSSASPNDWFHDWSKPTSSQTTKTTKSSTTSTTTTPRQDSDSNHNHHHHHDNNNNNNPPPPVAIVSLFDDDPFGFVIVNSSSSSNDADISAIANNTTHTTSTTHDADDEKEEEEEMNDWTTPSGFAV